jgi:hypothetical protein
METSTKGKKSLTVRSLSSALDIRKLLAKMIRAKLDDPASLDNEIFKAITSACTVFLRAEQQATTDLKLEEIKTRLDEYEKEKQ